MTAVSASHNPFATRFTRPGAIDFLFPPGESLASLVTMLRENHWQGEIIGPHGAGKSTLLAALAPQLIAAGRAVMFATLHAGERTLPQSLDPWRTWNETTQVIVDGYEQLTWWARRRLAWRVKKRGAGLLVTSHTSTGLPLLLSVSPRLEAAEEVVRRLAPESQLITRDDIRQAFHDCQGNIREMLFKLYDVHELRSRLADVSH